MAEIDIKEDNTYEMQLFREYTDREGELTLSKSGACKKEDSDVYEKTNIKHGDLAFYRFMKTIKKCPEQILR